MSLLFYYGRFVLVALVSLVLLSWALPAQEDFSVLSERWSGLAVAAETLEARPILSLDGLAELESPATLIMMPRVGLEPGELALLGSFLEAGGVLVVLDDFGYGNEVLDGLGVDVTFSGAPLLDPLYCQTNQNMPRVAVDTQDGEEGPCTMVLNHGSWLVVADEADVWARSSYFSYGDVDFDGSWDEGEPQGPLPVAATCRKGRGKVVAVSDASLLINGMLPAGDNLRCIQEVTQGDVLIDQVHLPDPGVDRGKRYVLGLRSALGTTAAVVAVVLGVVGFAVLHACYNRQRRYEN